MRRLSYLLELTPRETWRIVRHKLPVFRRGPSWTPAELMSSPKHSRGIRFAELLLRQEAVVRQHQTWEPLNFENKNVVEVGCGPLAGYGPLAIFCGASQFQSAEPEWNADLFFCKPVIEKYLALFHSDLTALYGPRMTFEEFINALKNRMHISRQSFDSAQINGPVDIILSQSVLEHVFPLSATVKKLAEIQGEQTRTLHLVDFGNHYPTQNPFDGLYEMPASEYISRRGKLINCLRMSDVAALFKSNGLSPSIVPSRVVINSYNGLIHKWWRERYQDEDLFTQLALLASPRP